MNSNNRNSRFSRYRALKVLSCSLLACMALSATTHAKFLGNIVDASNTNFDKYWNQVTPENSGKWESVEPSRDGYNWNKLDQAYNFAKSRGYPFKHHTFVWGSQEPSWLGSLTDYQRAQEVEELIRDTCARYPNMDMIDVVNEPLHAPSNARWGLGGSGSTGWDWVVRSFELARQYCPNSKLLLNDYGIINDRSKATEYRNIVNILKARGLIDGVGLQSHSFSLLNYSASTLKGNLDYLAQAGVPIYISEWDIDAYDQTQLQQYQEKFPVVWEHPSVVGVTIWGYVQGLTWMTNSGLMNSNGSERPALTWLKNYVSSTTPPPPSNGSSITVRASGVAGGEHINLLIGGTVVADWNLTTSPQDYVYSGMASGDIQVEYDNDDTARDVILDYVYVNNEYRQAEDMEYNTATYDGSCGGGSFSEIMHCNGVIGFGNTYDCFSGNCGGDPAPQPEPEPEPQPEPDPCAGLSGWSRLVCLIRN